MFKDLPPTLQEIVREHLLADDFKTAKAIHDQWFSTHTVNETNEIADEVGKETTGVDLTSHIRNAIQYVTQHGRGDQI